MVSEVGFGGGPLRGLDWGTVDDDVSVHAIRRALELGVTFFDTADVYGDGRSERVIGRALAGRREDVVIATKGGWYCRDGEEHSDFSVKHLEGALQASLGRLGTEYIDLYLIHDPSPAALQDREIYDFLTSAKEGGLAHLAGASVDTVEEGFVCLEREAIDVLQVYYNMLDQHPARELFREAASRGVGIVVKAPLARGLLTGKYRRDAKFDEEDFRNAWKAAGRLDVILEKVEQIRERFEESSETLAQQAIRFVLSSEEVSTVIPGAKTPEQAEQNSVASKLGPLEEEDLAAIREVIGDCEAMSWS